MKKRDIDQKLFKKKLMIELWKPEIPGSLGHDLKMYMIPFFYRFSLSCEKNLILVIIQIGLERIFKFQRFLFESELKGVGVGFF